MDLSFSFCSLLTNYEIRCVGKSLKKKKILDFSICFVVKEWLFFVLEQVSSIILIVKGKVFIKHCWHGSEVFF